MLCGVENGGSRSKSSCCNTMPNWDNKSYGGRFLGTNTYISSFCFFDDLSGSSCGDNVEVFLTKISGTLSWWILFNSFSHCGNPCHLVNAHHDCKWSNFSGSFHDDNISVCVCDFWDWVIDNEISTCYRWYQPKMEMGGFVCVIWVWLHNSPYLQH